MPLKTVLSPFLILCTVTALPARSAEPQGTRAENVAGDHNWPRWRGPHSNGSALPGRYPVKWGPEKILWKAPLPGKGCSTPIVWNHRIYVTAGDNGSDAVQPLTVASQNDTASGPVHRHRRRGCPSHGGRTRPEDLGPCRWAGRLRHTQAERIGVADANNNFRLHDLKHTAT